MVFIGYEPDSKAYRFYNLSTERVHISQDAVFEEGRAWSWGDKAASMAPGEPFIVEYVTLSSQGSRHVLQSPATSATPAQEAVSAGSPTPGTPAGVEFTSPPLGELDLDADHDDEATLV